MKKRINKVIGYISLILVLGLGYAGICFYTGFGIPCMFNTITGLKCSGCGITHMFLAILCLDFKKAFLCNQMLFCLLPLFVIFAAIHIIQYIRKGKMKMSKLENILCYIMIAVLVIWGIIRNIPV